MTTVRFTSAACLALMVLGHTAHGADSTPKADSFESAVKPFLQKHCINCHGAEKQGGSLALHDRDLKGFQKDREIWDTVLKRLQANEMPPPKKPQPTADEKKAVVDWINAELLKSNCTTTPDPGRVTLRRLNRAEYANTVRDLLGVDYEVNDDFPADDVGYGFDNIGDVLSLSPLLFEKYLAAAERIVERAFLGELPPLAPKREFRTRDFSPPPKDSPFRGPFERAYALAEGQATLTYEFPGDGKYEITYRGNGVPIDKDAVTAVFTLDGKEVHRFDLRPFVPGRGFGQREFAVTTTGGKHTFGVAIANPAKNPDTAETDPRKKERVVLISTIEIKGPLSPTDRIMSPAYKRLMSATPGPDRTASECARVVLADFARRAYRRPVDGTEVSRLVKLFETSQANGDRFEDSIKLALQAVLVSPHFVFKVEREPKNADRAYSISEHELATRLSYFLWSTGPDDELTRLADAGKLREQLDAQVRRMLADPRVRTLGDNFAGQWLQVRNLKAATPDPMAYPEFDEALRTAMITETTLFFEAMVRDDRPILDFIDANFTFVNERLAKHYGIKDVRGPEFRRVSLAGTNRAGILTHASVLTVTSNPTRTSPVKRGKFILESILNAPPPPPPPDAPDLKESHEAVASGSLRKRMEIHRTNPDCASCHQRMDPLGFAFENFDGIGAWRDKDGQFPIDPSGELPDGRQFKDPADLRTVLRRGHEAFRRCLAEKLLTFALGRGLEYPDRCAVDSICDVTRAGGDRFSALVLAIVRSDSFQKRSPMTQGTKR